MNKVIDIIGKLKLHAESEYRNLSTRIEKSVFELAEIKKKETELEQIILSAGGSHERLLNFRPIVNGEEQCPRCWIVNGIQSSLKEAVSSKPGFDGYECRVHGCRFFVEVIANPFRA